MASNYIFFAHYYIYFVVEICFFPPPPVFDLLPYSNKRVVLNFLQQAFGDPMLNEVYLLSTFKLQPKSTATVFGLYSSADNSKYFEFTVMGRMSKGELFGMCMGKLLLEP